MPRSLLLPDVKGITTQVHGKGIPLGFPPWSLVHPFDFGTLWLWRSLLLSTAMNSPLAGENPLPSYHAPLGPWEPASPSLAFGFQARSGPSTTPSGSGNGLGLGPVPCLRALGMTPSSPTVMRQANPPPLKTCHLVSLTQGTLPDGLGSWLSMMLPFKWN